MRRPLIVSLLSCVRSATPEISGWSTGLST